MRLCLLQQTNSGRQIRQIIFDELKVGVVSYTQFVKTPKIDRAGPTISAEYDIAFFKQKTAYEILRCLVGSEMRIRDSLGAIRD